jgi:tetratricopeptide (TPR) repeat protein
MKSRLLSLFVFFCVAGFIRAEGESLPDRTLRQIVEQQASLLAQVAKTPAVVDDDSFKLQMQQVSQSYEGLLRDNKEYAPGYAAYGYFLGKVGMRRESIVMLLKANQLDPDQPMVKNQIGNFLAEEGKPIEALPYFMAAIKLEPKEPLYHYQLGTLLHEARDDFIKSGEWTADALDHASHEAFGHAAELAPTRFEFAYRYAESFYDMPVPDWDAALKAWGALEEKAGTDVERQTMRLHAANILIKQGKLEHARVLLGTVTETSLQPQKQKLVAQLEPTPKK